MQRVTSPGSPPVQRPRTSVQTTAGIDRADHEPAGEQCRQLAPNINVGERSSATVSRQSAKTHHHLRKRHRWRRVVATLPTGRLLSAGTGSPYAADQVRTGRRHAGDLCRGCGTVDLTGNSYDVVLMNGCLHYVRNKSRVLSRVLAVSAADAVHAVAVFSTATPVPAEHAAVHRGRQGAGAAVAVAERAGHAVRAALVGRGVPAGQPAL